MKGALTVMCIFGMAFCVLAQSPAPTDAATATEEKTPPSVVYYDQRDGGAIGWDDFEGQIPADEKVVEEAEIAWGIHFSDWANVKTQNEAGCTVKPKAGTLKIRAYMVPKESWVKPGSKTPQLLRHEQGHFNIAHVYAQLLQRAVDESVRKAKLVGQGTNCAAAGKDLQRKVEELVTKYMDKCEEVQKLYDKETEHGTDANKQRIWDRKIKRWLEDFDAAPRP